MVNSIAGNSVSILSKSLDYLWLKQSVTSNNIANSETVGYKAEYVNFEEEFKKKLDEALNTGKSSSVAQAVSSTSLNVMKSESSGLRTDENNVNVDVEMVELTRTYLQYQSAINSLNGDFSRLSLAINGQ